MEIANPFLIKERYTNTISFLINLLVHRLLCTARITPSRCQAMEMEALNPSVASLTPSNIGFIFSKVHQMKRQGKPVIILSVGEPDFDTPSPISQAGKEAIDEGYTRYLPTPGALDIRTSISHKLKEENGLEYSPDQIVVSNGAKQSIMQAILAVCSPGDEVIIPAPYWECYTGMVQLANASSVVISTYLEDDFLLKSESLSAILTERSRLLILCSPSNPSGAVYPVDRLKAISKVVSQHPRLLVLADEVYEKIIYPPAMHTSFASLPGMWSRTLTVNAFSKSFAMTGWRLGYLAAPTLFAMACCRIQEQLSSCANSIAQRAGLVALQSNSVKDSVTMMVKAFEERRDYIVKRLTSINGVKLSIPMGAFYVFPDISYYFGHKYEGTATIDDAESFCRYLLENAEVALVPGSAFGTPTCVRLSYAASYESIQEALDRIEKALALLSPATTQNGVAGD